MNKYFYDLHIHSCLSPCGDDDMTPNNIAGMGTVNGLQIMALTDHNTTKNCPAFFAACKKQGIIPIGGAEVTTSEDIHILCLFPELQNTMDFGEELDGYRADIPNRPEIFGNQYITDGDDNIIEQDERLLIVATSLDVSSLQTLVSSHAGICYPAHIDRESNGMAAVLGDIPAEYGFTAFELNDRINERDMRGKYSSLSGATTVYSSDAHYLWNISEANNFFMLDDNPYSSSLVRHRLLSLLSHT